MFASLLKFEWLFINRKKSFYALLLFFSGLGLLLGVGARFPFPNTYYNGSYVLNFIIGIISLLSIFSTSILAAQTLFRETDAHFDVILYATPLRKMPYVLSRFTIIFLISACCYFLFLCGLFIGQYMRSGNNESFGPFHLLKYLQPYFILLLPNILFCTAIISCVGLFTRSKMLVYISGIFIYFLYWGVSFFTNSPLIANSMPVSPESMRIAALIDPFGLAAFLNQTQHWSAIQRNDQLLQLEGPLLTNRIIYLFFSFLLLIAAYLKFQFRLRTDSSKKPVKPGSEINIDPIYKIQSVLSSGFSYAFKSTKSFFNLEVKNIITGIAFWILCLGWVGFFCIETFSDISGNSRLPEKWATTEVMLQTIMESLPLITMIILVFSGSEIWWRSKESGFEALEKSTPVKAGSVLIAKWSALSVVGLLMLTATVISAIAIQFVKHNSGIDLCQYLSLFYLIGLPLVLHAGLIICIQALINNRWIGMVVAAIIVLFTNSSLGAILHLRHPLLRFANTYQGTISPMNGFTNDLTAFGFKMIFWVGLTFTIVIITSIQLSGGIFRKRSWNFPAISFLVLFCLISIVSGTIIFRNTGLISGEEMNNWREGYERKYYFLKDKPQPVVTDVRAEIDLYPSEQKYAVHAVCESVNKSDTKIDSIYIFCDREMLLDSCTVDNAIFVKADSLYRCFVFKLNRTLNPGDTISFSFRFKYETSPFNSASGYNTIINNGSFIRVSRFFLRPGYITDYEIDDPQERKKRGMGNDKHLVSFDAPRKKDHDLIRLETTISTAQDQTAIGVGDLKEQWTKDGRNYFQYISPLPIPFRFAVSSGRYMTKKLRTGDKMIEVYYSPEHGKNIDQLIRVATESMKYYQRNFGPYPFEVARFAEISSVTKGFAGTAYPGSLFINESFGYQQILAGDAERDILTEMVSHELSHNWWGTSGISPDPREGSTILTETLAMYSELMMHKKLHGKEVLPSRVNIHKEIYLGNRSAADEEPLIRSDPDKSYLCYDKGTVAMYQLYHLLGEEKMNSILRKFYQNYTYPNPRPVSTDLLNLFFQSASIEDSIKIDELFRKILTYDLILEKANGYNNSQGPHALEIISSIKKFLEDGKGNSTEQLFEGFVDIEISFGKGSKKMLSLYANHGKLDTTLIFSEKPIRVILDPDGLLLNRNDELKSKPVNYD